MKRSRWSSRKSGIKYQREFLTDHFETQRPSRMRTSEKNGTKPSKRDKLKRYFTEISRK
jgi:hypothetical protein